MPTAPLRPCTYPGCPKLSDLSRCDEHRSQDRRRYDTENRDKAAKKFYDSKLWQATWRAKLDRDPLCEMCRKDDIVTGADLVHHIDGDRWNLAAENLMSLCNSCHSKLETEQRGGFRPAGAEQAGGWKQ